MASHYDDVGHIHGVWQDAVPSQLAEDVDQRLDVLQIRHVEQTGHVGLRLRMQPDAQFGHDPQIALQEEAFDRRTKRELGEMR